MEIRVLRAAEVRCLLSMGECVELMRRSMIALSEGRAVVPLRSVMTMPGGRGWDLAILGAGERARSHLEAMLAVRPLRRIRIWARERAKAAAYARSEGERHGVEIEIAENVREAVDGADIVCTLTKAREPILCGDWLSSGVHLNVVGSSVASAAEIDTTAVVRSRFFVDCRNSTVNEGGEYLRALKCGAITAAHIAGEIGEVANATKPGRTSRDEVTLYKSLGVAAQDLASAHHVLDRARAAGIGRLIEL